MANFESSKNVRTVEWKDGAVHLIDQRLLPNTFVVKSFATVNGLAKAIKDMVVRGAPAIAAGAYGMVIAAKSCTDSGALVSTLEKAKSTLDNARPTAVNLMWATARMIEFARELVSAGFTLQECVALIEEESLYLAEQDIEINRAMGPNGPL